MSAAPAITARKAAKVKCGENPIPAVMSGKHDAQSTITTRICSVEMRETEDFGWSESI
jgi:hypothetical protein